MASSNVHLVVVHHGLWGSPLNTSFFVATLARQHGATIAPSSKLQAPESAETIKAHASDHPNASRKDIRMVVLNSSVNQDDHTYDGVDWCAERLVKEIYEEVLRLETEEGATVTRFSIIGYSLGGLIARYTVGSLYSAGFFASASDSKTSSTTLETPTDAPSSSATSTAAEDSANVLAFKSRPKPVSFSTLATPHLGVAAGKSSFSKFAKYVGSNMLGRSGRQLYLADRGWTTDSGHPDSNAMGKLSKSERQRGLCLLEAMADERFSFMKGLRRFERIDIYANAIADLTVNYRTAAFEEHDPFIVPGGLILNRDPDHPELLMSYEAVERLPDQKPFFERVASKFHPSNLPWILNPKRFPFRFPLNYLALLGLPVLLPTMIGLVLHRLSSQAKESNRRVSDFERLWAIENGHLDAEDLQSTSKCSPTKADLSNVEGDVEDATNAGSTQRDAKKPKSKPLDKSTLERIERTRISRLLAMAEAEAEETFREVGEDNVGQEPVEYEERLRSTTFHAHDNDLTSKPSREAGGGYKTKSNTPTVGLSSSYHLDPNEVPLSETQLRIAAKLNNKSLLPQLSKHLTHFEGILNAHPVIINRSPSIEAHRRGIPVIQAFAERFPL
ncbi:DUF676-domain-containing protein [Testicularia cyperi]|uniref:DUF676-domain-containing protein n=1 Tax=Testicularia cyperi TaxID=1882483 RepID=A0A317XIU5_9BASI|nr:DUF676-domain-containing protein [Testicularia cyperi]